MRKRSFFKISALLSLFAVTAATAAPIPTSRIGLNANTVKSGNVYIVTIPKKAGIANQTIGLQFCPDRNTIAGKLVRFSAEIKYSNIASDATGAHVGAKLLVSFKEHNRMKFFSTASLTGSCDEWKKYTLNVHQNHYPVFKKIAVQVSNSSER